MSKHQSKHFERVKLIISLQWAMMAVFLPPQSGGSKEMSVFFRLDYAPSGTCQEVTKQWILSFLFSPSELSCQSTAKTELRGMFYLLSFFFWHSAWSQSMVRSSSHPQCHSSSLTDAGQAAKPSKPRWQSCYANECAEVWCRPGLQGWPKKKDDCWPAQCLKQHQHSMIRPQASHAAGATVDSSKKRSWVMRPYMRMSCWS